MKRLLLLLSIVSLSYARKIEITLTKKSSNTEVVSINEGYCSATSVASGISGVNTIPANAGVATWNSGKCSLIVDEDNQKTTDYDFMTPTYFQQPTQIETGGSGDTIIGTELCTGDTLNLINNKCIIYNVRVDDEDESLSPENRKKYDGCEVEIRGLGSTAPTGQTTSQTHTGSKVHLQILPSFTDDSVDAIKNKNLHASYDKSTRTCSFLPVNHKYLGQIEAIVKFKLSDPLQNEVDDLYVKIGITFVPHIATKFGNPNERDKDVLKQHDAFVLMDRSKVANLNDDKCLSLDGIDMIGMKRSENKDLTGQKCKENTMTQSNLNLCGSIENKKPDDTDERLNTRSTGDGCITTGNKAYLYTESEIVSGGEKTISASLLNEMDPKLSQMKASEGTAVKFRVMGHFFDRRYKIIDQTGVETLEDEIGSFETSTQSLNVKADYINIGHTRKSIKTSNLGLKKLNKDDYSDKPCKKQMDLPTSGMKFPHSSLQLPAKDVVTNDAHILTDNCRQEQSDIWVQNGEDSFPSATSSGDKAINEHDYAQYYFDHDHVVAYEHIKHMQNTYINKNPSCGGTQSACANTIILSGFNQQVIVKIPLDIDRSYPKAPWNIFIPKLDIVTYGEASVLKLTSDVRIPNYGLPVLDTSLEPQWSDGYPLSHFFKINGVLQCTDSDKTNCDEVDSYDDKYELFHRLTKSESTTGSLQEYYLTIDGNTLLCSSNRVNSNNGPYGDGRVRDIGIVYVTATGVPIGTYMTQAQLFQDNCRLKINASVGTYFDQIILSWNNNIEARMCQEDEKTVLLKNDDDSNIKGCSNYKASDMDRLKTINYQPQSDTASERCTSCAKMTIIDRRKVLIGSTELSLLRRQEVFAGQGVEVQGARIGFLLGKVNGINDGGSFGKGVLEFDIWGTRSMQGYTPNAFPCSASDAQDGQTGVSPLCEEQHGCNLEDGVFKGAVSGFETECAEKKVKTPRNDGEFTFHSIRSTSHCNGKLDIQLRLRQSGDDDCISSNDCEGRLWGWGSAGSNNIIHADLRGYDTQITGGTYPNLAVLRPTYDVRLPCSRISKRTSDSIHLKYVFDLSYNLQTDTFSMSATGVSDVDGNDATYNSAGYFETADATGSSGFTKKMKFKAYIGACKNQITDFNDMTDLCDTTFQDGNNGTLKADVVGKDCENLHFEDNVVDGNVVSLDETVSLALVYERTYGYNVNRDHPLDVKIDDTSITNTQFFCEDQKFTISLNPTKTASVRVVTPIQLIVERQAEVLGITWHGNNEDNPTTGVFKDRYTLKCGAQTYQLRILIRLREQITNKEASGNKTPVPLPKDFTASIVSNADGLTVKTFVDESNNEVKETYITLTSPCILITANDCSGELSSQWKDLSQTSTSLLITADDSLLAGAASGTTITSDLDITTNFNVCPVDVEDVEESGEFAVALSFDANNCLNNGTQTALDRSGNKINNCDSALVSDTGTASLHAYTINSGTQLLDNNANPIYIHGALMTSPSGSMEVDQAIFSLKRFERGFGDQEKGQQLGDDIKLCEKKTNADLAVFTDGGNAPSIENYPLGVTVTGNFQCSFKFLAMGKADLLNDVWEIHVTSVLKNNATRMRLRSSKKLRLKDQQPLSSTVGFTIISDTTTVTEHDQAHSSSPSAESQPETVAQPASAVVPSSKETAPVHHEAAEDHGMLLFLGIAIALIIGAAAWYCLHTSSNDMECNKDGKNYHQVSVNADKVVVTKQKFRQLRY